MVNPRARKKVKNPGTKLTRKTAKAKKKVIFKGHRLLLDEWDKRGSLSENYKKMGLVSKLNGVSGGTVNKFWESVPSRQSTSKENVKSDDESDFGDIEEMLKSQDEKKEEDYLFEDEELENMDNKSLREIIPEGYGIIKRDAEGNIEKIVVPEKEEHEDSDEEKPKVKAKTEIAARLEEYAANAPKPEKWCSDGQVEFAQELINKHGLDYEAMFWDTELNTQQHSIGQLKRSIKRFLKQHE
ncbi:hypothetical protein BB559_002247 [Furculomyces boomerangus]|uniref:Nucleolar protein 16 n=2 Tax=Harpellales TaxID=61421 RepID=A0A2T9YWU0_9FUNG|nr:hypothetical protein BB559_005023 [Furculomyces boomerangus]PVU96797.1 hypothetical protein BB559_002247 [Furculomyces boomerangus]PVZ98123.1 hypothetical protein BB558_005880 [Smittium angustum]